MQSQPRTGEVAWRRAGRSVRNVPRLVGAATKVLAPVRRVAPSWITGYKKSVGTGEAGGAELDELQLDERRDLRRHLRAIGTLQLGAQQLGALQLGAPHSPAGYGSYSSARYRPAGYMLND